jgi:hypothetical protein
VPETVAAWAAVAQAAAKRIAPAAIRMVIFIARIGFIRMGFPPVRTRSAGDYAPGSPIPSRVSLQMDEVVRRFLSGRLKDDS